MKPRHQVSRQAVELIKRFEGFRERAAQLPNGHWTIGYGHTLSAREGAVITEADAEALLMYDLITTAHAVNEHLYTPLNQNQFDALVSFAFNIGDDNFRRCSTLRRLNEGSLLQAACAMELWRKADFEGERIVIDALVRRRAAEKTLFLTPLDGWVPAPTPILPPKVDYDASYSVPLQAPTVVTADLESLSAVATRPPASPLAPIVSEEHGPSASERAAAAVAARLEAILPEDVDTLDLPPVPEAAPVARAETPVAEAAPEPVTEPAFELTHPEETLPEPAPEAAPAEATLAEPDAAGDLFELPIIDPDADNTAEAPVLAAASSPEARVTQIETADFSVPESSGSRSEPVVLAILALFSIALFAGAVFFGFNAGPENDGSLLNPKTLGWILSIVAIACFGGAAFFLLERLGGKNDNDPQA